MLKRLHPHVTPIATTITKRLFDVHKFTLEWSSDAIVDGAYKSEAFVYLSEHLRDFHTWNKFYDDEGGQCLFSLIIEIFFEIILSSICISFEILQHLLKPTKFSYINRNITISVILHTILENEKLRVDNVNFSCVKMVWSCIKLMELPK